MPLFPDLSGNGYQTPEAHIPTPGGSGSIDPTGLATDAKLQEVIDALPTDPATETTLLLVRTAVESAATSLDNIETDTSPIALTSGPPTVATATIANGQSLSDAVEVDGKLVTIITPAAWTAADMTFQGSQDGTNFYNIYDDGTERIIASANIPTAAVRVLSLDLTDWIGIKYVKIRSGTAAVAVNQGASRAILLVMAG